MANYRKLLVPAALAMLLLLPAQALAQRYQPFGPVDFGHDLQPFAPGDFSSFDGGPDPNTGFYGDYARMYVNVNRHAQAAKPFEGDFTWGNRMTFGYMSEQNHGWLMEIMHINNANVLGPFPADAEPVDENDDNIDLIENAMDLTSVELMKVWRWKPLHQGSIVEPFAGLRFTQIVAENLDVGIENNIYGAQAGMRWTKRKGRWKIGTEGRYFYGYNRQFFDGSFTLPDGTLVNDDFDDENWVYAGDFRVDVTYNVTKAIAVLVGGEFLYMGTGVALGEPPFNDQDYYAAGVVFGISVNR